MRQRRDEEALGHGEELGDERVGQWRALPLDPGAAGAGAAAASASPGMAPVISPVASSGELCEMAFKEALRIGVCSLRRGEVATAHGFGPGDRVRAVINQRMDLVQAEAVAPGPGIGVLGRSLLCQGVRHARDLAYRDYIEKELPHHEFLGDVIGDKLRYFPAVTREPFTYDGRDHRGRMTDMMATGQMMQHLGIEPLDPEHDRAMICGSPQMLADFRALLDGRGFTAAPRIGTPGQYVFERAFVEK